MKKIKKGDRIIKVTNGAFEENFKGNGWEVIKEPDVKKAKEVEQKEESLTQDEKRIKELEEKPLGRWNAEEVKFYADSKEIDVSNTKTAKEAKEIIKDFLD